MADQRAAGAPVVAVGYDWATAAKRAGVSLTTLKGLVKRGECPSPRCVSARRRLFMSEEFESWLVSRPTSTQGARRQRRRGF